MSTQHTETLIIGAGQAGLATAYQLRRQGRGCLVVDAHTRIGNNWRCHYDSLKLFTPARSDGLEGMPYPGDPWEFPAKDEFADYLESYAVTFGLPVRLQSRVERLSAGEHGGFTAYLDGERIGERIDCDNVVVATGTFGRTPNIPDFAPDLAPGVRQLHAAQYRRPSDAADGPVLVVGASHSGLDIAHDLAASHEVVLVGPDCGNVPLEWGSRRFHAFYPLIAFAFMHVLTRRTPMGRKVMGRLRYHGAPQLRVKRAQLEERGVEWITEHVVGADAGSGLPALADGRTFDVGTVVWATGYRQVFDWIDLPVPVRDGWPVEYRGVVEEVPGLYFCGLAFQYAFASGEIHGVSRDADYLARHIVRRAAREPVPVAA